MDGKEKDWIKVEKGIYKRRRSPYLWIVVYKDGKLYRESSESGSITAARRLLKLRGGQAEEERLPARRVMKIRFDEIKEDFLSFYRAKKRKSIKRAELSAKHLSRFFGGKRVSDINHSSVNDYINARRAENPSLANGTLNREIAALKKMLHLAAKAEKIHRLPVLPDMLGEAPAREGFVEDETFDLILRALPLCLRPLVLTLYETGMRSGEALHLTWEGADTPGASGWIFLRQRIIRLKASATKSGHGRAIALTDALHEALRFQKDERDIADPEFPWVFFRAETRKGKKGLYRVKDFRGAWEAACERAELGKILVHDLRRSAVRRMVRAGIPDKIAMEISGHRTRSVFDRYNIVDEADLRAAAKRLSQSEFSHFFHTEGVEAQSPTQKI